GRAGRAAERRRGRPGPPERVMVGAHYDTVDQAGFLGANDGASGAAVVVQLARMLEPRTIRPTVTFVLFDGEEARRDTSFLRPGRRGSRVAAQSLGPLRSMVLLDMVGDRELSIPRESNSQPALWASSAPAPNGGRRLRLSARDDARRCRRPHAVPRGG